mmetsp:Transcript_56937/g.122558  ORF Transcript_56937/g.122558 Transcript_56937/m.122558 type:complete len:442 (+) Transcript_56937:1-1326(+)
MQWLLYAVLLLSLALAVHVGYNLEPKKGGGDGACWDSETSQVVGEMLGGCYFVCTLLWLAMTTVIKIPLCLQARSAPGVSYARTAAKAVLLDYLLDSTITWRFILLICCSLALFTEHLWLYSFLVADFFCQDSRLATVLKGIIAPGQSLMMTFIGAVIVTFVYGAVGFNVFREDFGDYCNTNIVACTQSILYQSTRNGIIGLSSMMDTVMPEDRTWGERMPYDISHFVVFGIMLLNTIVALIVDSFSTLRRDLEARESNHLTETFISCMDRKRIESCAQASGIVDPFVHHEEQRQPKWDYMAFIFHLHEKNAQDYTGPEQAIRTLVEKGDVKWLPLGRSKMLEAFEESGQEDAIGRVERQMKDIAQGVRQGQRQHQALYNAVASLGRAHADRAEGVQAEMATVCDQLRQLAMEEEEEDMRARQSGSSAARSSSMVPAIGGP